MKIQELFVFILIMGLAGVINALVAVYAWKKHVNQSGVYFALLMAAVTVMAFTNALEMSPWTVPVKIFWAKMSYIGVVNIAPFWFCFAIHYSHQAKGLDRRQMAGLWVIPVVTLALAFTNEWHHLVWPSITPLTNEPGSILVYDHGVAVYINVVYAYLLLLVGSYWLVRGALHSANLYQMQVAALATAALIPWVGNLLYIFKLNPWPGVDLTVLAFTLTGVIMAWALFSYHVLDLAPVAQEVLFNNLDVGIIVLDKNDRLVDFNPTARRWTGLDDRVIGQDFFSSINATEELLKYKGIIEGQAVLIFGRDGQRLVVDMNISPLLDGRGKLLGRVASLFDVTHEHNLMEAEVDLAKRMEMLNDITREAMLAESLETMLQPLVDRLGNLFHADNAYLTLWDDNHQVTIPAAAYGQARETYQKTKILPGDQTLTEYVLRTGSVLVLENTRDGQYISPHLAARFPASSMMALPMVGKTQKMGGVLIAYDLPHHFSPAEVALGQQAAGQVALAMERVRLLESEKRYIAQLLALQAISKSVLSSLDLHQIFETVVQVLNQTFNYHYVSIYRFDGSRLVLGAQVNYPKELVLSEIPLTIGVMGRSVRTRQPQFVQNVRADQDFLLATYEVESEICVPLMKGQTVLGTLNIESRPPQVLTDTDMLLMTTFASQVAIAIEHAQIFTEMQQQTEKERLLLAASREFSAGLGSESILQAISRHITAALAADTCLISRWDPDTADLIMAFDYRVQENKVRQANEPYMMKNYPMTRAVLETRQPMMVSIKDPAADETEIAKLKGRNSSAALVLPLVLSRSQQVFGIVEIFRTGDVKAFDETHLELAESLLAQASVALENARLYTQMVRHATTDELTGLMNRRRLLELGKLEFDRAVRFQHSIAALFLDIDHFKKFNDDYSYAVGDQVLHLFAESLLANLRNFDLVGRYGGEEFVILLPETNLTSARDIAERIRRSVENIPIHTNKGDTNITVSIGVCLQSANTPNLEMLVDQAGEIVHQAKANGRNRVEVAV